jgi:hypothetical protein
VIPSNHKWFRNLAVSQIICATLEDMGMKMPEPSVDIAAIGSSITAPWRNRRRAAGVAAGITGRGSLGYVRRLPPAAGRLPAFVWERAL